MLINIYILRHAKYVICKIYVICSKRYQFAPVQEKQENRFMQYFKIMRYKKQNKTNEKKEVTARSKRSYEEYGKKKVHVYSHR